MTKTKALIAKTLELAEKATKEPWKLHKDSEGDAELIFAPGQKTGCDEDDYAYNNVGTILKLPVEKYGYGCAWASEDNGEFIAHSRTAAPVLARMVEATNRLLFKDHGCLPFPDEVGRCAICTLRAEIEKLAEGAE